MNDDELQQSYLHFIHAAHLDMAMVLQKMALPGDDGEGEARDCIQSLRDQARWLVRAAALWNESLKP